MVAKLEMVKPGDARGTRGDSRIGRMVLAMAKLGLNRAEVGGVLELSATAVEKTYGAQFRCGQREAESAAILTLYRAATDAKAPNVPAAKAFLKFNKDRMVAEAKAIEPLPPPPKPRGRPPGVKNAHPRSDAGTGAPPPLGKKAEAELTAKTAERGSDWDGLLS